MSGGEDPQQWNRDYEDAEPYFIFKFNGKTDHLRTRSQCIEAIARKFIYYNKLKRGKAFSYKHSRDKSSLFYKCKVVSGKEGTFRYLR